MKIFFKKNNKKKISKLFSARGFLAIEVLVAVSIITISVLAAMAVSQKAVYVSRQALHASQVAFVLEEGAENVRIARDNAWVNVVGLNGSLEQVGVFTRMVSVASVNRNSATKDISATGTDDPNTKLITITVSWVEGGATITKTLQFYLMNIFS